MQDSSATTSKPYVHPHPFFNWDVKWNFNHGSKSAAVEATTTTTTTVAETSTEKSSNGHSGSGHFGHKKIDVNWSFDFNHGSVTSAVTSSTQLPIQDDETDDEWKVDETPADDKDDKNGENDIDPRTEDDV
jgi:hypothetical protein